MRVAPVILVGAVVLGVAVTYLLRNPSRPRATAPVTAPYSGSASCASCHSEEYRRWQQSQHAAAMAVADTQSVLGRFDDTRFTQAGVTTRFFRRDGKFMVNTDGPDGKLHDFEIAYTFGVYPLQQYLIPFPGGRFQALGIAWDARPAAAGGQRWFHLYPAQRLRPGNPLHWTGIDQVWNYQCAECHSTNLRKGYDTTTASYHTTWSELVVGCEACHGPGSEHIAAQRPRDEGGRRGSKGDKESGLVAHLRDSTTATWLMDTTTGIAHRSVPLRSRAELETCARCHARRGVLSEDYLPGRSLAETHRPALLDEGLYEADGQMRDEVYNYGSFLQSRMSRAGVTCSDCHDPHGARLPDDSTCARCHLPARFATTTHHHHQTGSAGASCVACHMPTRTYMVVDQRHDHGFKVPRPDLTVSLGTPNTCTDCHSDKSAGWAAQAAASWFPALATRSGYATALWAARQGLPEGKAALERLVQDTTQPAIVRATAVTLLGRYGGTTLASPVQLALWDRDPLVRAAGLEVLSSLDPGQVVTMGAPLLSDSIRLVRVTAARALAGARPVMDSATLVRFEPALAEYRASEMVNVDRPEARINLGNLAMTLGDGVRAEREYSAAIALDSTLAGGYINLADLYRATGRDAQAEPLLRQAVAQSPGEAGAHQALGLLLVRLKRSTEALAELKRAAALAPENPRFALVEGVAFHDLVSPAEGIRVLTQALARHPADRDLLMTLAAYSRETGDLPAALGYAKRVAALDPRDAEANRLFRELQALSQTQDR